MGGEKPEALDDEGQLSTIARTPVADQTLPATRASAPDLDLAVNGTLGRYRLVNRLGEGAMGVVWCALDPQLDRRVAIKVVHDKLASAPEASTRLLREARAMAKLSHRAVVTVHDAGETDGRLFVAMELVEGTTLGQMLRARSKEDLRDWRRWLDMVLAAGRGLEAAHGAGVLHRDFKPDNVLVDNNGRVCVADFGLAMLGGERPQPVSERVSKARLLDLTTTGALLGTPAYMSPQQLRGEAIDERADQFSFCVTAFEALYGARPFESSGNDLDIGEMIAVLERAIEHADVRPVSADSPVPDAVLEALRRGLAADPEQRWTSMTTLLAALERAARGKRTVSAMPVAQPPRSRLVLFAAVGASALAILAIVAIVLARADKPAPVTPAMPVAKRLFDVPLKTRLAVTRDGKRLLLASDRLEVRELDGTHVWTASITNADDFSSISVSSSEVVFGVRNGARVDHWRYATDNTITTEMTGLGSGSWVGETTRGNLFYFPTPQAPLVLKTGDRVVREWATRNIAELFAVSPDRRRVAVLEAERVTGEIVVRDVERGTEVRGPMVQNLTALAWQDDQTLIYATSTEKPTLFRVRFDEAGFGTPQVLYGLEAGWMGEIAVGGGRLFFVEMGPKSRARVVDRSTQLTHELDAANVGAALAWTSDDEFLAWNRNTKRVERRTMGKLELTSITLAGEPANATIADGVLIAAVRTRLGRDVVAHDLATGKLLWTLPAPAMHAVRCANDRHPPCFGLRRAGALEQVVSIDPTTGAAGKPIYQGMIEDIAVNEAGDRIAVALRLGPLRELAPDGTELQMYEATFSPARSVAYDTNGGFLLAGTLVRNTFQVARFSDGKLTPLAQAENDLLSMVRPSSDGRRVLVHARIYAPVLWELALP